MRLFYLNEKGIKVPIPLDHSNPVWYDEEVPCVRDLDGLPSPGDLFHITKDTRTLFDKYPVFCEVILYNRKTEQKITVDSKPLIFNKAQ